jgi:hypothetical protein
MLENTDKAIGELLQKLPDIIKSAEGQLPDIANQMLVWGVYDAKLSIYLGVAFVIFAILILVASLAIEDGFVALIGTLATIFALLNLSYSMSELHKIKEAPKVYLLEKVIHYSKSEEK